MPVINLLDVHLLTDDELVEEYRQIQVLFNDIKKLDDRSITLDDVEITIPQEYTGDPKFFYDKLSYVATRFDMLVVELIQMRGMSLEDEGDYLYETRETYRSLKGHWKGHYIPGPNNFRTNMARLCGVHTWMVPS